MLPRSTTRGGPDGALRIVPTLPPARPSLREVAMQKQGDWIASSRRNPCPICGRSSDGDCRISGDGDAALCHYGDTFAPPAGLKPGEVVTGKDGNRWAYTGDGKDGRTAHFTIDKPQRHSTEDPAPATTSGRPLARLPQPAATPPDHWQDRQRLIYTETTWVVVTRKGGNKRHLPYHRGAQGNAIGKAGPDPWPLWQQAEALQHGPGSWIAEAEGEKCADWLRAGGLVAVSQPGHDHSPAPIEARYRRLQEAGILGLAYLADHDKTGKAKAEKCAAAAVAAGLGFRVIHAADLWPGIPAGGSIDDAPGTAAERCKVFSDAVAAATVKPEVGDTEKVGSVAEVKARLREEIDSGIGSTDLAALVAELSIDTGIHRQSIDRIAVELERERDRCAEVEAEAQALDAEADRRDLGQLLKPDYLLPATIAAAVEDVTRYLPGDGPSRSLPYLVAVAGLAKLGTMVEACNLAGFSVPVNLYGCLVADSGRKKSPTHKRLVAEPLKELRDELNKCNQKDRESWQESCNNLAKGQSRPPEPIGKRLIVGDFTGEALAQQLEAQEAAGLGLLIHRDELSGLFGSLNQYRGGKGSDEQQLLELFDGGGLTSLRVSGHRTYNRSQVSIWGGTQTATLRKLVANGDDSGLWARFLFVPLPERVVPLPIEQTDEQKDQIEAAEQTLASTASAIYRMPPNTYRLSRDATAAFVRYEENRQRAAIAATIGAEAAVYGKSAGKVARLAGVIHLLRIATGEAAAGDEIGADLIERAAALVDHLDAWVVALHTGVAGGGTNSTMATIHRAAERAGRAVRWKEIQNALSASQRKVIDSATAAAAMHALADRGFGQIETGKRGGLAYRALKPLPI